MNKLSANKKYYYWTGFCILLIICLFIIFFTWTHEEKQQEEFAIQISRTCEAFLPINEVKKLNALPEDINLPEYISVKEHLKQIVSADDKLRFAYILVEKNGEIFFMADSEPETSEDYSPPGQKYDEAKPEDKKPFFDGKDYVTSSLTDRWGTWRSVYVPIKDKTTNKVIAVLGIDIDSDSWFNAVLYQVIESVVLVILFFLVFIILTKLYFKNNSLKIIIDKQQIAEVALLNSEQKFRNLVEASSDMIWETDINRKYSFISQNVENILGYKPSELIGKTPFELMSPEEANRVDNISTKIINDKFPFNNLINTVLHKNGHEVLLETSGVPIFDTNNSLQGFRGIDRNITDRKFNEILLYKRNQEIETANKKLKDNKSAMLNMMEDMEKEIKERKQATILLNQLNKKINLILEVAGEGVVGVDTNGIITFVNPTASKLLGYSNNELLEKHSHSTFHHSYPDGSNFPSVDCPNYATLKDGLNHRGEDYFWKKDGTGFYVVYSSAPVFEDEIITGAVITFIDITERKKSEEAIKLKSDELERFNNIMVGREIKMIALKKELNELLKKHGGNEKYKIAE